MKHKNYSIIFLIIFTILGKTSIAKSRPDHVQFYNVKNGKTDSISYNKMVDEIIYKVRELKNRYPESLSNINHAKIEKSITENKFWIDFYYSKGLKWVRNHNYEEGSKSSPRVKNFARGGIEIHIYFYTEEWPGQLDVAPIEFGKLNIIVLTENDNIGIKEKIYEIISQKKSELSL